MRRSRRDSKRRRRRRRDSSSETTSTSSSSESSVSPRRKSGGSRYGGSDEISSRRLSRGDNKDYERSQLAELESRRMRRRKREREEQVRRRHRRSRHSRKSERRRSGSSSRSSSGSGSGSDSDSESGCSTDVESDRSLDPKEVAGQVLHKFPGVASELKQLLQMIDKGQGVDVRGISNKPLRKLLKKLFLSLKLEGTGGIFLLSPSGVPTLEVIGSLMEVHSNYQDSRFFPSQDSQQITSTSPHNQPSSLSAMNETRNKAVDAAIFNENNIQEKTSSPPRRRLIGPEMPSRELLDAAAELTQAETLLREADFEMESSLFIGPPPPSMVAEAESTNEAERFEEVARISSADINKPYDVLGANWKMSFDNIKKRYWKLSLMVHPDKCSHPEAHKAFITLNKAFKELQDPEKRNEIDEKLKFNEEQELFMAELKSMREAAQWRRLQGVSMEGDEELLAVEKEPPKRDEWMTKLPPERKPGMTMHSTSFSRNTKDGRGDTSMWTDSPMDKAEKAKQNYLEAYKKANLLANVEDKKRGTVSDADLIDKYNASKRGKSLVKKHQEESRKPKKKATHTEKEEWQGQHPWKPWDREKDLSAGRSKANFDSDSMIQGLASRFSSGAVQRNFL